MNKKIDYTKCFAFENFSLSTNPYEYEFSSIDTTIPAPLPVLTKKTIILPCLIFLQNGIPFPVCCARTTKP